MRVLIVSNMYYPYIGGGAELSVQILAENLVKSDVDIEILTLGLKDEIEIINEVKINRKYIEKRSEQVISSSKLMENKLNVSKIEKLNLRFKDYFFKPLYQFYYNFIKKNNFDIVHTANNMLYFDMYSCWKAAKDLNVKVIHTIRDSSLLSSKIDMNKISYFDIFHRAVLRKRIKEVSLIHSPSKFLLELHKKYKMNIKNDKVIYNTVNLKPKINNFNKKENKIVYVGIISEKKGILTLVEAYKELIKIEKDLELCLVGEGELVNKIKKEYSNLNINFTGWISQEKVFNIIEKSKVLILPSEWNEAFGRVLIEGVYSGTLVVGSNRGAIPEVLNFENDYIFEAGKYLELNKKILKIINMNKDNYNENLKLSQIKMEKYSIKNHIILFKDMYNNIINKM